MCMQREEPVHSYSTWRWSFYSVCVVRLSTSVRSKCCAKEIKGAISLSRRLSNYYRPQTKFAKVMFLQVCVCPHGGGACVVAGGHVWLPGGACVVAGGVHGCWGCAWLQGVYVVARGVCMVAGGHAWLQGCAWLQGACMVAGGGLLGVCMVTGGHVWLLGVCLVAGGVHGCWGWGYAWLLGVRGMVVGGHAWDTMRYSQWVGGMHPTGMHSCFCNRRNFVCFSSHSVIVNWTTCYCNFSLMMGISYRCAPVCGNVDCKNNHGWGFPRISP